MRIAITASGDSPDSLVDGRFVAARYILILDMANGRWETVKLSLWSRQQKHSGKIRAGQLEGKGIASLITGGVDPVSFRELGKRGIRIFQAPETMVREAAEMFSGGYLPAMQFPDAVYVTKLVKMGSTIEL